LSPCADSICSNMVEDVLMTVSDPAYLRDIARARFLYSVCLKAQGKTSQAITELIAALRIYNELCPGHQRTTATLSSADIEGLVPYDYL
jgi:hypothetical protein